MNGRPRWARDRHKPSDVAALLRDILQQQTAMLQVQAESVRLQRVLVERLLGISGPLPGELEPRSIASTSSASKVAAGPSTVSPPRLAPVPTTSLAASEPAPNKATVGESSEPTPVDAESHLPFAPAPVQQNPAHGARYYQPRPSPTARSITPEELELMRRLQEMRDASDLILRSARIKHPHWRRWRCVTPNTSGNTCGVRSDRRSAPRLAGWCKPSMEPPSIN